MRSLLAFALVLSPAPTAPATVAQAVISPQAILQVLCVLPAGYSAGTAFRVGNGLYVSVNHVTAPGSCLIDGKPVKVLWSGGDFSMLRGDAGPFLAPDCNGFVKGHRYLAIGYARGIPKLTAVDLVATGASLNGFALLSGVFTVVPGQSGGPVVDLDTGKAVGTINTYEFTHGVSGSVPLKDTPVCQGGKP